MPGVLGERHRQAKLGPFALAIKHQAAGAGTGLEGPARRGQQDAPEALRTHGRQRRRDQPEGGIAVDPGQPPVERLVHLGRIAPGHQTGAVDQTVETAEAGQHRRDQRAAGGGAPQQPGESLGLGAFRAQSLGQFLGHGGIGAAALIVEARIVDRQTGPLPGQDLGVGPPQAAPRPGDKYDPAV